MIKKILIANRGEIAVRIIKTCKKLNILTVAVYSDIDEKALFVQMADEAYPLYGVSATETYLNADKVIEIIKKSKVDAVHPGYGFLSENADFAAKVDAINVRFIGPSSDAITAMGMKSTAKILVEKAGIATIPGYNGVDNSVQTLVREANKIGYPLLIKAAAGGGGKGMRIVQYEKELLESLHAAKRESLKSFANDDIILEKYLAEPRHIEVQVLVDNFSNGVYLFERDCSIQRRYQKIIEEAPAPNISASLRKKLGEQALAVAKSINYTGVGTIEFLLDNSNNFYFMEMNTRLQVEHPVTEFITGLDLVELQIHVANNQQLPFKQADLKINGHAIEARIYAEDIINGFLPATGFVDYLEFNQENHVRVDSGIQSGDEISIYYDPMVAKVISYGCDRQTAINHLTYSLKNSYLIGMKNNVEFILNCLSAKDFQNANISTKFIENNVNNLLTTNKVQNPPIEAWLAAAIYYNFYNRQYRKNIEDPWQTNFNYRVNQENIYNLDLTCIKSNKTQHFIMKPKIYNNDISEININLQELSYKCSHVQYHDHYLDFSIGFIRYKIKAIYLKKQLNLFIDGTHYVFSDSVIETMHHGLHCHQGSLTAPMHGTVVAVNVKEGAKVFQGDTLIILEAMKMEHVITAPSEGIVTIINFSQGQQVPEGAELLVME